MWYAVFPPPLLDLERHYSEDDLVAYLRDPAGVQKSSPRLQALSGEYPQRMPPMPEPDEESLRLLAHYLLGM